MTVMNAGNVWNWYPTHMLKGDGKISVMILIEKRFLNSAFCIEKKGEKLLLVPFIIATKLL